MSGRVETVFHALFVRDIALKLLSLAIAVALYTLVHGAEDVQRTLTVPLLVTFGEDADRMLVSDLPDSVKVVVNGRSTVVNTLRNIEPIVIDLRHERGAYYYLEPSVVRLPAGVRVVRIVPDAIPLQWDRKVVVRRPVQPQLRGVPLEGFEARLVRVEPAQVTLEGPLGQLGPMQQVRTEPLDVRGLAPGRHLRWAPLERLGSLVRAEPSRVEVSLEVVPRRLLRRLRDVQVEVPPGWKASPSRVAVELEGPPERVASLRAEEIRVLPSSLGEGGEGGRTALHVEGLPEGVRARAVPAEVSVTSSGRLPTHPRSRRRVGGVPRSP